MRRIATENRDIDRFGAGKDGFRAAVPGVSEPTFLSPDFCNAVQESIVRLIEEAGFTPTDDNDQFVQAIRILLDGVRTGFQAPGGSAGIGHLPAGLDAVRTDVQAELRAHAGALGNIEGNLNFTTLKMAAAPAADTDLMIMRQGDENRKIPISVIRQEFSTVAAAQAALAASAKIAADSARDEAQSAALAAAISGSAYATIAAGRADVLDGAPFTVRPNAIDGLTRVTLFLRISSGSQLFVTDTIRGAEFDAVVGYSGLDAVAWRDTAHRVGAALSSGGTWSVPAAEIGLPLYPLPAMPVTSHAVLRSDIGVQQADIGEHSGFASLDARVIHGQDYSLHKPVRDRRLVADEGYSGCLPSPIAGRAMNCRKLLRFPAAARNLRFAFANTFWIGEAGGYPTAGHTPGRITVRLAIEHQGIRYPLTVNGQRDIAIDALETVETDTVYIDVDAGSDLPLLMFVTPTNGGYFPVGTPYFADDGVTYTIDEIDQTLNSDHFYSRWADVTYGPIAFGPIAVTGQAFDPAIATGVLGDSIGQGSADAVDVNSGMGWAHRALTGGELLMINLSQQSEAAAISRHSRATYARWRWLDFVDHVICEYGVNDLNLNPALATVQADLVRVWRRARDRGAVVWQTTITPVTSSTDGWATIENQTVAAAYVLGGTRVQLNDWIRAGAPLINGVAAAPGSPNALLAGHPLHPLHDYIEMADTVESARNSCKWAVADGVLTDDGVHPRPAGHARMAVAVPTNRFI